MEPPFNEPQYNEVLGITKENLYNEVLGITKENLYNEVLGITKDFLYPVMVKYIKKDLDMTKPRYSEHVLPVPWPFNISRSTVI